MSSCMVSGFHCFDGTYSSIFRVEVNKVGKVSYNIDVRGKKQFMEDGGWPIEVIKWRKDVQASGTIGYEKCSYSRMGGRKINKQPFCRAQKEE